MSKDQFYTLGVKYLQDGNLAKAIEWFGKAKDRGYNSDVFNYNFGLAYAGLNRFDEAIDSFKCGLKHEDTLNALVVTYHRKFDFIEDVDYKSSVFDSMLRELPKEKDFSAQHLLNVRSKLLDAYITNHVALDKIIGVMGKYIDIGINEKNQDTLYFCTKMGKIYLDYALKHSGACDPKLIGTAKELLQTAYSIAPNDVATVNNLAITEEKLGPFKKAIHIIASVGRIEGELKNTLFAILMNHNETVLAEHVISEDNVSEALIGQLIDYAST